MIIKIALPKFLSVADENRFFSGFHGISAVREFTGVARGLNINLDGRKMTIQNTRELIALLYRYGVELEPLAVLSKNRYSEWLKNQTLIGINRCFHDRMRTGKESEIHKSSRVLWGSRLLIDALVWESLPPRGEGDTVPEELGQWNTAPPDACQWVAYPDFDSLKVMSKYVGEAMREVGGNWYF